jgi:hypothetical protein
LKPVKHRPTIAAFALIGALAGGFVINLFEDEAHRQGWIPVVGYLVLALLVLFVSLVLAGLAGLVRRTFEDTRRGI